MRLRGVPACHGPYRRPGWGPVADRRRTGPAQRRAVRNKSYFTWASAQGAFRSRGERASVDSISSWRDRGCFCASWHEFLGKSSSAARHARGRSARGEWLAKRPLGPQRTDSAAPARSAKGVSAAPARSATRLAKRPPGVPGLADRGRSAPGGERPRGRAPRGARGEAGRRHAGAAAGPSARS